MLTQVKSSLLYQKTLFKTFFSPSVNKSIFVAAEGLLCPQGTSSFTGKLDQVVAAVVQGWGAEMEDGNENCSCKGKQSKFNQHYDT